jgi:hypothetical protein
VVRVARWRTSNNFEPDLNDTLVAMILAFHSSTQIGCTGIAGVAFLCLIWE